jgi:RHS repeat-associated protein
VRNSGASTFQHGDRLGTFALQTNASQTATAILPPPLRQLRRTSSQCDSFRNLLSSTGTAVGAFGFAGGLGYQEDSDSSLKLLGHRNYDPSTGRFLTRDPAKTGRNWYVYGASSPLRWGDPSGLLVLPVNPNDLLSEGYQIDYSHQYGTRYIDPGNGWGLDWHPGTPGRNGWGGKDHYHPLQPGPRGMDPIDNEHYPPGYDYEFPKPLPEPIEVEVESSTASGILGLTWGQVGCAALCVLCFAACL